MTTARNKQAKQLSSSQLDLHKALSHRLRAEILTLLAERTKASPVEMSRELPAPVGDISHHVKQLVKYGCAEEVDTRPRRGAVEHFYRAVTFPVIDIEAIEAMPPPARRAFGGHIAQKILDDVQAGFEGNTLEAQPDHHMTRVHLTLDSQGWRELTELHMQTYEETYEIQARSNERRSESNEEPVRFSSCQLCFELPAE